jgi:peptidoglycan/xylan/chitin deacetylase (PgdA/CDA1 family)
VRDVLVLCYHAVSPRWAADLSVTPKHLEEQLDLLLRRGYRGMRLSDAISDEAQGRVLAVTFDDAYRSVLELAFPLLERLGIPGTVFVPTKFARADEPMAWPGIDQWLGGEHESELSCMSWEELARLDAAGWEIGSHTHSHPRLTTLDDDSLADELGRSREICTESLGKPCRSLAYPYGDHDARVVAATEAAGYTAAVTLPPALHRAQPLRWPRLGIYHHDTMERFRAKVSPAVRRLRSSRGWGLAMRGRH